MYKSKEVCQEDLSWELSQLLLRRHGLIQTENVLWIFYSPSCFFQKELCRGTKHCWRVWSLCPLSLSMTSFQCPGVRSASLCPCCVLWVYRATPVQAQQPESAGSRGETSSWGSTKCLPFAHLMVETKPWAWTCCVWSQPDHWYNPRALNAWLVHTQQHLRFLFCVRFTIGIGKNPTNLNSFRKS